MKRLLLPLLAVLALPTSVNSELDPYIHNLCLPAKDYEGCIKFQTKIKKIKLFRMKLQ